VGKEIPIYKAEAEAGLADLIQSKDGRSIATVCPLMEQGLVAESIKNHTQANHFNSFYRSDATNKDQFDLEYVYTILATTGWNRNDDVFDRLEMWSARNTAEDKPFNKGHDPNEIIGHITGNAVVDESYELVKNDSEVDSLPTKFHILTSAVIYKHVSSRDDKLTTATKELLREISEGKWFVSMEALFTDFDYALRKADGEQIVVARNEETAFLSKHLRAYGGVGEYDGSRVGRLMKNLTFSGKGLVQNPGNPESIIFKEEDNIIFNGVAENSYPQIDLLVTSSSKGDSSMSDNNEQVRNLESQVEKLEARLKELDAEKVQAKISTFEKACADKDAEISELSSKIEAVSEMLAESKKAYDEISVAKSEADTQINELTEKLEAIEASAARASRISALVDVEVDKADAEVLVDTFDGISDEQFDAIVSLHADYMLKKKAGMHDKKDKDEEKKSESGAHDEDEKKKKKEEESAKAPYHKEKKAESPMHYKKKAGHGKDEEKAKAGENFEVDEAAEAADTAEDTETLNNAEVDDAPALAAQSEEMGDAVVASLNDYFSKVLSGNDTKS